MLCLEFEEKQMDNLEESLVKKWDFSKGITTIF
jgi:hypothetical protein